MRWYWRVKPTLIRFQQHVKNLFQEIFENIFKHQPWKLYRASTSDWHDVIKWKSIVQYSQCSVFPSCHLYDTHVHVENNLFFNHSSVFSWRTIFKWRQAMLLTNRNLKYPWISLGKSWRTVHLQPRSLFVQRRPEQNKLDSSRVYMLEFLARSAPTVTQSIVPGTQLALMIMKDEYIEQGITLGRTQLHGVTVLRIGITKKCSYSQEVKDLLQSHRLTLLQHLHSWRRISMNQALVNNGTKYHF